MRSEDDNETWLIETGADVVEKKAAVGEGQLSQHERLIYCLWVADYGMRNAGDLETASDLDADFQVRGKQLAAELSLAATLAAFNLPTVTFQERYFELFDAVCDELRTAG
jgi:hypothetical protein